MRSVEVAPRGRRPPIRLRPVPPFEPPFDDELAPEVWASAPQLAFNWPCDTARRTVSTDHAGSTPPLPARADAVTEARPSTSATRAGNGPNDATPTATARTADAGNAGPGSAAAVVGASVDAKLAVRRFVSTCVEVLNGHRPATHLRRLSAPREAAGIVAQGLAAAQRVGELRRAHRSGGPGHHGRRPDQVAVLGLRLCEPRPGAVEAAVVLVTANRTWALALRLEQHQQSWAATTLRVV